MLSVIVNFYNNRREAKNTLHSLTRQYQRNAQAIPYEVIALDNGSSQPLSDAEVTAFGPEFRYRYIQTKSPSPVTAINAACQSAAGDRLLIVIDGAHILTPSILQLTNVAFQSFAAPFIATVPFHLGPKIQNQSVLEGYNQTVEDELLARVRWREDGYRLYEATGSFSDGSMGWFGCLLESSCFALRKTDYLSLGGFDERFQSRGGGLTNLDIFKRALSSTELEYVLLLGEGTFHQFHGGVASNAPSSQHPWEEFHEEYVRIRGAPFERSLRQPLLLGSLPPVKAALNIAKVSANKALDFWQANLPIR